MNIHKSESFQGKKFLLINRASKYLVFFFFFLFLVFVLLSGWVWMLPTDLGFEHWAFRMWYYFESHRAFNIQGLVSRISSLKVDFLRLPTSLSGKMFSTHCLLPWKKPLAQVLGQWWGFSWLYVLPLTSAEALRQRKSFFPYFFLSDVPITMTWN